MEQDSQLPGRRVSGAAAVNGRRGPRFSLLTSILLMTIAAMGVLLWRLNGELAPLRREVLALRQEQGRLTIDDPEKIYAIQVRTDEPDTWRWRVYLPPSRTYTEQTRLHTIPGRQASMTPDDWHTHLLEARSGGSSDAPQGEFLVEVRMRPDPNEPSKWTMHYRLGNSFGSMGSTMPWLDDRRAWSMSSNVSWSEQTELPADQPLDLFMLRQGVLKELPGGGYSITQPSNSAETPGVMLWITPGP